MQYGIVFDGDLSAVKEEASKYVCIYHITIVQSFDGFDKMSTIHQL